MRLLLLNSQSDVTPPQARGGSKATSTVSSNPTLKFEIKTKTT